MPVEKAAGPDGSVTFKLSGKPRLMRDDVVQTVDEVLGRAGKVMHMIDPSRVINFPSGGPPVWSVGLVEVTIPKPYGYALTYGMSHVLSPEDFRAGIGYELSIAIAGPGLPTLWAVGLLRQLARYALSSGNELMVGDVMPCGVPITRLAFGPNVPEGVPDTTLDSIVVVPDPVIPRIDTAHGPIEVRRLVGVDEQELSRLGPMPPAERVTARAAVDPLMLTTI